MRPSGDLIIQRAAARTIAISAVAAATDRESGSGRPRSAERSWPRRAADSKMARVWAVVFPGDGRVRFLPETPELGSHETAEISQAEVIQAAKTRGTEVLADVVGEALASWDTKGGDA